MSTPETESPEFTIYRYATPENEPVWTGTPGSMTAPIDFTPTMRKYGPRMRTGDRLILSDWFYAVKN